jgi:hypothetical protein
MTTLYLARKWCHHGQHEAPADSFRSLPITNQDKRKRDVCQRCFDRVMAEREKKKAEGFRA